MRVAVAGATGHIGALTAAALERDAHDVVHISRSHPECRLGVRRGWLEADSERRLDRALAALGDT